MVQVWASLLPPGGAGAPAPWAAPQWQSMTQSVTQQLIHERQVAQQTRQQHGQALASSSSAC